jgi:uncharacterized protein YfkK (UPF0435 family)
MQARYLFVIATFAAMAGPMCAQPYERRATFRGGNPNEGKCTIEVVVDGAAEVEVRGDTAVMRNLSGQPPQWRRFECSGPLPANPGNFRFKGIDGRGRQQLIRDPRSGGSAVVRIEDPDNGSEGYTFDLIWNGAAPQGPDRDRGNDRDRDLNRDRDRPPDRGRDEDAYHRDRDDAFRGNDWRQYFFQRIREDVEHVRSVTFPFSGDQYRLARVVQQLDELQGKLAARRYDQRELDDVIDAMQRVVRDNRLSPRDRDALTDDLSRMREFRSRRGQWGPR